MSASPPKRRGVMTFAANAPLATIAVADALHRDP
jgi:hypothetical protein